MHAGAHRDLLGGVAFLGPDPGFARRSRLGLRDARAPTAHQEPGAGSAVPDLPRAHGPHGVVVASGSAFIYFLQPIAATTVVGLTFFFSSFTNNPMVDRLAKDFCPLTSDIVARRRVRQLFRRLTIMWAAVNILNAGITCWLLLTQSVAVFVAVKPIAAMVVTWSAVAITVLWSLRVARQEGLRTRRAGVAGKAQPADRPALGRAASFGAPQRSARRAWSSGGRRPAGLIHRRGPALSSPA